MIGRWLPRIILFFLESSANLTFNSRLKVQWCGSEITIAARIRQIGQQRVPAPRLKALANHFHVLRNTKNENMNGSPSVWDALPRGLAILENAKRSSTLLLPFFLFGFSYSQFRRHHQSSKSAFSASLIVSRENFEQWKYRRNFNDGSLKGRWEFSNHPEKHLLSLRPLKFSSLRKIIPSSLWWQLSGTRRMRSVFNYPKIFRVWNFSSRHQQLILWFVFLFLYFESWIFYVIKF